MLTIDTIPLKLVESEESRAERKNFYSPRSTLHSPLYLFIFFMRCMTAAATAKLFEFQPIRRGFLIFCRNVIALLTLGAL